MTSFFLWRSGEIHSDDRGEALDSLGPTPMPMAKYLQIYLRLPGWSTTLPRVYGSYCLEADSTETLQQIIDRAPRLLLDNCRWSHPEGLAAIASALHRCRPRLERAWTTAPGGGSRCVPLWRTTRSDLALRPAVEVLAPLWRHGGVHVGCLQVGLEDAAEAPPLQACL